MTNPILCCLVMTLALGMSACYGWQHTAGLQVLPEATYQLPSSGRPPNVFVDDPSESKTALSRRVSLVVPGGWHWVKTGNNFMATKDGIFLQKILVERFHYLNKRLTPGMSPTDVANALLNSLRSEPLFAGLDLEARQFAAQDAAVDRGVKRVPESLYQGIKSVPEGLRSELSFAGLGASEVVLQDIAGNHGFKVIYDFKFAERPSLGIPISLPKTSYRTVCYGFMLDEWVYSISYTATQRYFFQKDIETFESVLRSFRVIEK